MGYFRELDFVRASIGNVVYRELNSVRASIVSVCLSRARLLGKSVDRLSVVFLVKKREKTSFAIEVQ